MNLKRVKLGDLSVNITDGEHGSVIDDPCGGYFLLSNKNIQNGNVVFDESDRKINKQSFEKINKRTKLENGDVVISTVGTIGRTSIIENATLNYDFQRSVGIIKTNQQRLNNRYLHYYFQLPYVQKRLQYLSKGAIQKCLFISDLKDIDVDIPENLDDQKRIGDFLGIIDSKIKLNNKINAELESMAKLIYDFWFVQFDFPDENGKPYKSSGGKMVYNEELNREIPEGWISGGFERFSDIKGGSTPTKSNNSFFTAAGKGLSWITPKDLSNNTGNVFIKSGETDVTEDGLRNANLKILPKGSVLMSSRAPIGYVAINSIEATTNQGFKSFVPKEKSITEFLYFTIKSSIPIMEQFSSGSTFKEISASTLKTIQLAIPSESLIDRFSQLTGSIFRSIELREQESDELTKQRDWLLPMLMNGQVTIKD